MLRLVNCVAVIFLFAICVECSENKILINSLNRLLDFLMSDSEKVDVDCLFGVVIAEGMYVCIDIYLFLIHVYL